MRLLRLSLAALALTLATAHAQTPPAQPAPPPKKIPALGISLTDSDRAELTAGTTALRAEIDTLARDLASPADAPLLALLPDVEIFHKAVAWSLADDTFYSTKEIAFARHLLTEGRERAAQLRAKKSPWLEARGLIVRGHRSKLDGSIQPYGLVVPADLDLSKPTPAMVWLLGRGEKRTELAFLAERENGPPQLTPKNTLTLIPYGRFCNATKFAGEIDVMEALAAVRAQYSIDPLRIAVAGFSMGGGSTWHLATHFPGLWCAASPGAGFAETPIFTKANAPGKEVRPVWEQLLWRQYEATGISQNLFNVPTLAYAGEIDGQKEASDLMEAALAQNGLKLERFIGPQTAHKYHDATKAELTARLETLITTGRPTTPREIRFSTYTLRYPESAWLRILALEKHWERADVHATLASDDTLTVTTKNVTALAFSDIKPTALILDGQRLAPTPSLTYTRRDAQWSASDLSALNSQLLLQRLRRCRSTPASPAPSTTRSWTPSSSFVPPENRSTPSSPPGSKANSPPPATSGVTSIAATLPSSPTPRSPIPISPTKISSSGATPPRIASSRNSSPPENSPSPGTPNRSPSAAKIIPPPRTPPFSSSPIRSTPRTTSSSTAASISAPTATAITPCKPPSSPTGPSSISARPPAPAGPEKS